MVEIWFLGIISIFSSVSIFDFKNINAKKHCLIKFIVENNINNFAQQLQSCPTLCNPMNFSLPGSSVHGTFSETILEWVALPSSRGSSQPREQTCISCIAGGFFTPEPPGFKILFLQVLENQTLHLIKILTISNLQLIL